MADMKIVVAGAAGRMGQSLIRAVADVPGIVLSAALEQAGSPNLGQDSGALAGIAANGIAITDDPLPVFAAADGVLDFTVPAATIEFAALAAQARIVHVIGTTGMNAEHQARIEAAARHARIMQSGNYSVGVILLSVLVKQAAAALKATDFDIEVLEMHHKHKIDAPSGTALLLGEAAAEGRGIDLNTNSTRTRDGITGARDDGTIGFATLRGGSIVGEHSVFLSGDGETIELSHRATDRQIFARGAVKAALWAFDQKPGLYSMLDMLGLKDNQE